LLLLTGLADPINAEEASTEIVEEIVVTGSYLKRSPADSASPLSTIDAADIQDYGAVDVGEIVQNLPWQSGSIAGSAALGGEQGTGRITLNLRNLGDGSTLILLNGKRNVPSWYGRPLGEAVVNLNALVPNIAIERIEIVKDGASALYGSDAIAGVANFITNQSFEGVELQVEASTDEASGEGTTTNLEGLFGVQGDWGGLVASFGFLDRNEISVADRYERFGASGISTTGQPGQFRPTQDVLFADGSPAIAPGTNSTRILPRDPEGTSFGNADLNCENAAVLEQGGTLGLFAGDSICAYEYGPFFPLQADEELKKLFITGHFRVSDSIEIYTEIGSSNSGYQSLSSWNPSVRANIVPAHNLGLLEDARRRGIMPQPLVNQTRVLGGTPSTSRDLRPVPTFAEVERDNLRAVVGMRWTVGNWTLDGSAYYSDYSSGTIAASDTLARQLELALAGLGGPACDTENGTPGEGNLAYASGGNFSDGNCYYFNPFGSHAFDASGNPQTDLALINPPGLYGWLQGVITRDDDFSQTVYDLVASGDLFEVDRVSFGLALGIQRRIEKSDVRWGEEANNYNLAFLGGADDWSGKLTTTSLFGELGTSFGESVELNVALRYEDFKEIDQDTTDYKVTLLWRPVQSVALRGSLGTSFRVPSQLQLFGTEHTFGIPFDPVVGFLDIVPVAISGTEDVAPQTATTWNIGASWTPGAGWLSGLSIDLDYFHVDYEDLINAENVQNLVTEDGNAINAEVAATGKTVAQVIEEGVVGNRRQVLRPTLGRVVRVLPEFTNTDRLEVSGLDVNLSYGFSTGLGFWQAGLSAAWIRQYDMELINPDGSFQEIDGVGSSNFATRVGRPLPEWKVNATLGWTYGNHSAFLIVKYVDGYDNSDVPQFQLRIETVEQELGHRKIDAPYVKSWTTADIQYSYTLPAWQFISGSTATIGIRNVNDEKPSWINRDTGFDTITHDPRGRVWYIRYKLTL
jgi:outer membrane receptor protein involved in Fe transport